MQKMHIYIRYAKYAKYAYYIAYAKICKNMHIYITYSKNFILEDNLHILHFVWMHGLLAARVAVGLKQQRGRSGRRYYLYPFGRAGAGCTGGWPLAPRGHALRHRPGSPTYAWRVVPRIHTV